MGDVVLMLLTIGVGALFCFRGYLAMRVIIPIWGAFTGFVLGAGAVTNLGPDGFLHSATAWLTGIAVGLVFGALAYLYFEISVVLALSAVGFVLGTSLLVALGITWSWLIVLGGLAGGVLLAAVAVAADLPMLLLTLLTAFAGASVTISGVMLAADTLRPDDLDNDAVTERLGDNVWWYVAYLGLALAGVIAQLSQADRMPGTLRDGWAAEGGHQLSRR